MRTAIVTGAGGGLGSAISRSLAAAGWTLYLTDIAKQPVHDLAAAIVADGAQAHAFACDVSQPESVEATIETIHAHAARIDLVVNNAGTTHVDDLLDLDFDTWRRVMSINADGVFLVGQAVARRMATQDVDTGLDRRGMIVNVGSTAAEVGRPPRAAYGASKAVVKHLTMTQALALADSRIAACLLYPGEVMDGMLHRIYQETAAHTGRAFDEVVEDARAQLPRRMFQTAEEIGDRVEFLASSPGMEHTGTILWCDSRLSAF